MAKLEVIQPRGVNSLSQDLARVELVRPVLNQGGEIWPS